MSDFEYISNVSDVEFKTALTNLHTAILKKDTPEEWAKFTGNVLLTVGKLAINHFGFGPAITLIEQIFGDDATELVAILKLLGDNNEND